MPSSIWPSRERSLTRRTTTRERTLAAPIERVWQVVSDPAHMARWWPGVQRMEGVHDGAFTQVFLSKRGRTVRADFRIVESVGPGEAGVGLARVSWRQETEGTPFERVLADAVTEVLLEGGGLGSTRVILGQAQRLRGYSRTGGFLLRRATSEKLDEALENLARAVE